MKLYWPESTTLISKSAKFRNLQKLVIKSFKVKIGLSHELMNDIFEFIAIQARRKIYGVAEAVVQRYSLKKMFLEIWQKLQENT